MRYRSKDTVSSVISDGSPVVLKVEIPQWWGVMESPIRMDEKWGTPKLRNLHICVKVKIHGVEFRYFSWFFLRGISLGYDAILVNDSVKIKFGYPINVGLSSLHPVIQTNVNR
jgi:hypothetical protein